MSDAMWSVKPQTVYVVRDVKLEFKAQSRGGSGGDQGGRHVVLDITYVGDRGKPACKRVRFSPGGDVLRIESLPVDAKQGI